MYTLFTGNLKQKIVGVCNKKEVDQLDTLLPVHSSTESDVWKQAQPVTEITDAVYPFNTRKTRPTENEVRHTDVHNSVLYKTHVHDQKMLPIRKFMYLIALM